MRNKPVSLIAVVVLVVSAWWVGRVTAGSLDAPTAPASTSSYGLDDIYERLDSGAAGTSSNFAEPGAGPGSTMNSLNEIMAVAPITKTNGATKTQVISGTTFWGLTSGQWGVQTGTLTVSGGGTVTTTYIPKTGQTLCYNTSATISCGATSFPGQDGDYQKGVAWPDPRFITSTTGIVTDTLTGLIWLEEANCSTINMNWTRALTEVQELNTAGTMNGNNCGDTSNAGSHQTDWRLPNVKEYESLIDFSQSSPSLPTGHPFQNVQTTSYWSSTSFATNPTNAWYVNMNGGNVNYTFKSLSNRVWAVRGGQ